MASDLPKTHRALVLRSKDKPIEVETIPTPRATPGSVVIRVEVASVVSFIRDVYNGERQGYDLPLPVVPGASAIGRIVEVGPDAAVLAPGQLVLFDITIRGRDDRNAVFLSGITDGFTPGSKKLMRDGWRDGSYAEYARVPLENCYRLDEKRLLGPKDQGGLGYKPEDLLHISKALVPFGGLRTIDVKAGETIIISPATGGFGGAAVKVALAMGVGKIIVMGRNAGMLEKLIEENERVVSVPISGDVEKDLAAISAHGPVDAYFDISPPAAAKSSHFSSCILSLKRGGRICFMGGVFDMVPIPYIRFMLFDLVLKGKWMFDRSDIEAMLQLVNAGILKLGPEGGTKVAGVYGLEQWKEAFDYAVDHDGPGEMTVMKP